MPNTDSCLIIFAKAPDPGKVKTRLIPTLGQSDATNLYKLMLEHTINTAVRANLCDIQLWCAPDQHHPFFEYLSNIHKLELCGQVGDDLGQRMKYAFATVFKKYKRAIIIGTDCPYLQSKDLKEVFELLNQNSVVIIPAVDGGYVLLGISEFLPDLFKDIDWGTSAVFDQTILRLANNTSSDANIKWTVLTTRHDIDRAEDIEYLQSHLHQCNFNPRVKKFIKRLDF